MSESGRSLISRIAARLGYDPAGRQAESDRALFAKSGLFDAGDYLASYPDVAGSGVDPLLHYVRHGVGENRNPSRAFDAARYAADYPQARESPLRHYLTEGRHAGAVARSVLDPEIVAIDAHQVFDSAYYLDRYPDAASSAACNALGPHLGAISHYVEQGSRQGRRPCSAFDTAFYVGRYGDVAASGINPLLHYCAFGWKELRDPCPGFDAFAYGVLHMDSDFESRNLLQHLHEASLRGAALPPLVSQLDAANEANVEQRFVSNPRGIRMGAQGALVAARWFIARKRWSGAEIAYERFFDQASAAPAYYREFAKVLSARGQWKRAVAALRSASALAPGEADPLFRIGQILAAQGFPVAAAEAFEQSAKLDPGDRRRWYEFGYALESSGEGSRANAAYARAMSVGRRDDSARFGVGVLHQQAGRWPSAIDAYRRRIAQGSLDAELHYRLGFALDRCHEWKRALDAYGTAISLRFANPGWHYRYAYVLERLERWSEAAEAYAASALLDTGQQNPDAALRRGYVLAKAGRYKGACAAYVAARAVVNLLGWQTPAAEFQAEDGVGESFDQRAYRKKFDSVRVIMDGIDRSPLDAARYVDLGELHEAAGDVDSAVDAYRQAVARLEGHDPDAHYRLGRALASTGKYEAAAEAFAGILGFRSPIGFDMKTLKLNQQNREIAEYCDFRDTLPVSQNVILYESYGGVSMACNPYAIFRHVVDRPEFSGKLHVWVLNDKMDADPAYIRREDVIFVTRNSRLHRMYLATAGYLIHNSSFPALFVRRPQQRYLNTWHGTPLKTLGRDIKGNFMERRHSVRSRLQATHLINPNPHTTHVLMDRCDIAGLFEGKLAETGYPRNDVLVVSDESRQKHARRRLGITSSAKIVLYAPTWRGILFHPEIDPQRLIADLAALSDLDCEIVFRGHYFAEQTLKSSAIPVHVAPHALDTADLLAITDVLVTDYSSVFFDFLPTRRPILFYTYDLDEYVRERGLYFDMHEMPGSLCMDIGSLREELRQSLRGGSEPGESYERALQTFAPHEDGQACRRAVDFFFRQQAPCDESLDGRMPRFLAYAGDFDTRDTATSSIVEHLRELSSRGDVTLLIDPDKVGGRAKDRAMFDSLPPSIRVIGRIGARTASIEELQMMTQFNVQRGKLSVAQEEVHANAYAREFERLLGQSRFDVFLNFCVKDSYWTALLAYGGAASARLAIVEEFTQADDISGQISALLPKYEQVSGRLLDYAAIISASGP